ncbi:MAG: TIGR00341 family protein [Pseudothermotoga sp.]|uniref:TIGR00341 family protein n=1 Tax=Pseudothermotoga sp. TaxID=2033661 RepID=UPI0019C87DF2|nr:TIGR00341 family protein [Pseudothermotoga sp.]
MKRNPNRDVPYLYVRTLKLDDETGFISILLKAENVEAVTDKFVSRFASSSIFRLVVLPVEATFPLPAQQSGEKTTEGEAEESKAKAERISREELYEDIAQAGRFISTYLEMVALSTIVASVGLIRGDVAIIIGAMVIAPLLGPNIALSLAVTLGDLNLTKNSPRAIGAGVATSLTISMLIGILLHTDSVASEIAARAHSGIEDISLALAVGTAESLAFTTGVSAVVVGVMISVALLPPLVAAGILTGAGHFEMAMGAFALFLTNITCINLAAIATFLLQRMSPRTWWEAARAKHATRLAVTAWVLMLCLLFFLIFFGFGKGS